MSGLSILVAVLVAGAPAPPEPECEPLPAPKLRAGCWGLVRLKLTNSSSRAGRAELYQRYGPADDPSATQSARVGSDLAPGRQGEYFLPFRPLSSIPQLGVDLAGKDTYFDGKVVPADVPVVVEVRASAGALLKLPVQVEQGRVRPDQLPEWPAGYEGVDLLVIADAPPAGRRRAALAEWFRAGGRALVTSEAVLLDLGLELLGSGRPGKPASEAEWRRLLGSARAEGEVWKDGRPVIAGFGRGFGRGLLVVPGTAADSDWSAAAQALYRSRPPQVAPLVRERLYHHRSSREDLPGLAGAMVGAGRALRWSLGAVLVLAAATALFWRPGRRGRFLLGAGAGAVAAALAVGLVAGAPQMRGLSLRVEEFSPDGAGVRAREYLYLEKIGTGAAAEIRSPRDVLPSPILYSESEATELSYRLERLPTEAGGGFRLAELSFGGPSLFLGAGPLAGAAPQGPPPAARSLDGLDEDGAVSIIADCLAPAGSRCRAQAEFLARALWSELRGGAAGWKISVCRLPLPVDDAGPALRAGGVDVERLGRLGVFYR
jgi:hypothetical protein